MVIFKKTFFALPFLLLFYEFLQFINPFLVNPLMIFDISKEILFQSSLLTIFLIFSLMCLVIFITLAADWKIILPVIFISSLLPLWPNPIFANLLLSGGFLLSFSFVYALLRSKLLSYFTFKPISLLVPSIKQSATLIILVSSLVYFVSATTQIKENGFKLPDSLLDLSLQFIPSTESGGTEIPANFSIPPEQTQYLKENPQLLKQYGLDPTILDTLENPSQRSNKSTSQQMLKKLMQQGTDKLIAPYLKYLPTALAVLFFLSFQFLVSIASLFLPIFVWPIFWLMEKSGLTQYEVETRQVRKLVV